MVKCRFPGKTERVRAKRHGHHPKEDPMKSSTGGWNYDAGNYAAILELCCYFEIMLLLDF